MDNIFKLKKIYDGGVGQVTFVKFPFSSNCGVAVAGKSRNSWRYVNQACLTSSDGCG